VQNTTRVVSHIVSTLDHKANCTVRSASVSETIHLPCYVLACNLRSKFAQSFVSQIYFSQVKHSLKIVITNDVRFYITYKIWINFHFGYDGMIAGGIFCKCSKLFYIRRTKFFADLQFMKLRFSYAAFLAETWLAYGRLMGLRSRVEQAASLLFYLWHQHHQCHCAHMPADLLQVNWTFSVKLHPSSFY
jgi:hypothetical protein